VVFVGEAATEERNRSNDKGVRTEYANCQKGVVGFLRGKGAGRTTIKTSGVGKQLISIEMDLGLFYGGRKHDW